MSSRSEPATTLGDRFRQFAHAAAQAAGSVWAFALALGAVLVWMATGPMFAYSNTWQLVVNTGTTIATFLMVFLVQNTQNRDARAIHLKLDELIRHIKGARNSLIALEDMTDEELDRLEQEFRRLRRRSEGSGGAPPTPSPRSS
jgi:low affinity Fe/Cu permease